MGTTVQQPRAQTVAEQAAAFSKREPAWGEMKERKEPRFIKFGDGEQVEGVLLAIERVMVNGKPASRFLVMEDEGDPPTCAFLGTFQIESQVLTSDIGYRVRIRCEGTNPAVTRNGNAMKKFRIWTSEKPAMGSRGRQAAAGGSAEHDLGITDEDIPF